MIEIKYRDKNGTEYFYKGDQNGFICNTHEIPTGVIKKIEAVLIKWMEEKVTKR